MKLKRNRRTPFLTHKEEVCFIVCVHFCHECQKCSIWYSTEFALLIQHNFIGRMKMTRGKIMVCYVRTKSYQHQMQDRPSIHMVSMVQCSVARTLISLLHIFVANTSSPIDTYSMYFMEYGSTHSRQCQCVSQCVSMCAFMFVVFSMQNITTKATDGFER